MANQQIWFAQNPDLESLFQADPSVQRALHDQAKTFKKGDYIYLPDEKSDSIYFILEGQIKVGTFKDNEREIIHAILYKGAVFGETSILEGQTRKDFALASEDVFLAVFTSADLKIFMQKHIHFSLLIMKLIGDKIMETEDKLKSLVFKDSRTRIIEFLIQNIENKGQRIGYEWVLRNFFTHQDIANLTSTSRQTVTMVLNELRNENIVQFDRKRLLVRDLEKLKSLVKIKVI
jgi:CRP-like cAMP-binding protein